MEAPKAALEVHDLEETGGKSRGDVGAREREGGGGEGESGGESLE